MIGSLNVGLVTEIKQSFEQQCISLLKWACERLKAEKNVDGDWGEENISANIYTYIKDSEVAINADIFVESEHSFYSQDILDNKKISKSAPRIDLVFQNNWSRKRSYYYVEAKNVVVCDYTKTGRSRPTKASKVQKRYIETGMDHFLSAYYPKGCLLGYVLNGKINEVVNGINTMLIKDGKTGETLQFDSGVEPWLCYKSHHSVISDSISHFFFNFN